MDRKFEKLRIRSPAPVTSTSERQTSDTTSAACMRCDCLPPVDEREPDFRASFTFSRLARQAGRSPKSKPARAEMKKANAATPASIRRSAMRGSSAGSWMRSRFMDQLASSIPRAPPASACSMLSVNICRIR